MITVHHAPRTRSVRVVWLLEELDVPYAVRRVDFAPPREGFFRQDTPFGKLPVLDDGGMVFCESGAILEHLADRYAPGRLAPLPESPERGPYLQWMHYAEGTLQQPLSTLLWHAVYKGDAETLPGVMRDARERAAQGLAFLDTHFGPGPWLLGETFSAADVMLAFNLVLARMLGVLDAHWPRLLAYVDRLEARPAYRRAVEI